MLEAKQKKSEKGGKKSDQRPRGREDEGKRSLSPPITFLSSLLITQRQEPALPFSTPHCYSTMALSHAQKRALKKAREASAAKRKVESEPISLVKPEETAPLHVTPEPVLHEAAHVIQPVVSSGRLPFQGAGIGLYTKEPATFPTLRVETVTMKELKSHLKEKTTPKPSSAVLDSKKDKRKQSKPKKKEDSSDKKRTRGKDLKPRKKRGPPVKKSKTEDFPTDLAIDKDAVKDPDFPKLPTDFGVEPLASPDPPSVEELLQKSADSPWPARDDTPITPVSPPMKKIKVDEVDLANSVSYGDAIIDLEELQRMVDKYDLSIGSQPLFEDADLYAMGLKQLNNLGLEAGKLLTKLPMPGNDEQVNNFRELFKTANNLRRSLDENIFRYEAQLMNLDKYPSHYETHHLGLPIWMHNMGLALNTVE